MAAAEQLCRVFPYLRAARAEEVAPHLQAAAAEAEVNTPLREAMWLAQLGHESDGFRHLVEMWGPTPAQLRYERRADLGNVEDGDGSRFRGRGAIQLTGRTNYTAFAEALGEPQLLEQPDLVATLPYAFRAAAWYWRERNLNVPADAGDVERCTRIIDGGLNGIDHREELYDRACDVLGV